jgi:hypothetical protein
MRCQAYRQPGSSWRRFKDNIKKYHKEIGWKCVDWMFVGQEGDQGLTPVNRVTVMFRVC